MNKDILKMKGVHIYPEEGEEHDHFEELGFCICKPVPYWHGWSLFWMHRELGVQNKVVNSQKE